MTDANRGFQGMPADTTTLDMIEAGDLLFAVEYRHVGSEEGPSVHVGITKNLFKFLLFA